MLESKTKCLLLVSRFVLSTFLICSKYTRPPASHKPATATGFKHTSQCQWFQVRHTSHCQWFQTHQSTTSVISITSVSASGFKHTIQSVSVVSDTSYGQCQWFQEHQLMSVVSRASVNVSGFKHTCGQCQWFQEHHVLTICMIIAVSDSDSFAFKTVSGSKALSKQRLKASDLGQCIMLL